MFLTGLEEGVFPHARSMNDEDEIEEERRLCYVGLTRARERLFLSYALHRRIHGYGVGEPSRFLREMPENQLVSLEHAGARRRPAAPTTRRPTPRPPTRWARTCRSGSAPEVRHARFGEGLVVGIERDGADYVVTVGLRQRRPQAPLGPVRSSRGDVSR